MKNIHFMKKNIIFLLLGASFFAAAQNTGIGTTTPTYGKLEIVGGANPLVARTSASGAGISFYNPSGSPSIGFNSMINGGYSFMGAGYGSFLQYNPADGKLNYFSSSASGTANTVMGSTTGATLSILPNGNMGLGNADPAYILDVNGRMRLGHRGTTSGIWFNQSDNTEGAFLGHFSNNVFGLWGPGTSSNWRFGFDLPNTRLGIGTMAPLEGVHLLNKNIRLDDASSNRSILVNPNGYSNAGSISMYYDDGTENIAIRASDGVNQSGEIIFRKPGVVGTTLEIDGDYAGTSRSRIIVDEIQIKGGADFAEFFDVKATGTTAEPGMLVCIDAYEEGKMTISTKAYDKKVAGVISGANGIKAGMMMGHQGTVADGKHPVAISGRVYVKATAFKNAIKPGDLLTTSARAGYAMKADNNKKATGAIIGKSMGSLEAGSEGFVLVLLNIQ